MLTPSNVLELHLSTMSCSFVETGWNHWKRKTSRNCPNGVFYVWENNCRCIEKLKEFKGFDFPEGPEIKTLKNLGPPHAQELSSVCWVHSKGFNNFLSVCPSSIKIRAYPPRAWSPCAALQMGAPIYGSRCSCMYIRMRDMRLLQRWTSRSLTPGPGAVWVWSVSFSMESPWLSTSLKFV